MEKKNVIIEEPSYLGAISSFRSLSMAIDSFKYMSELVNKLNDSNILYTISDFRNPSTSSYNDIEREILINIINRKKTFFIEDGAYTFLNFKNIYNIPISKYCEKSFHLGSFFKILVPGLRIGWIRANKKLIDTLLFSKESLDLHTSTLNQMIIDEYLNKNDIFNHIKTINKEYSSKMNFMCKCIDKYLPNFIYKKPKGGMFIYGKFDRDSMLVANECLKKGLAIIPAEVFYIDRKSNEARLNFTNSTYDEIEKGIKILS